MRSIRREGRLACQYEDIGWRELPVCNDLTIGSYNDYHLSTNNILSGNQRWYSLVYLVYKRLVNLRQG